MKDKAERNLTQFALEVFFSKWEFKAKYHMCASDMESMTLSELLSLAGEEDRAAWLQLRLGYTETMGRPSLREAIAATYATVPPDNLLCFSGAQEGIYAAMHALLGPQDHAIAIMPNYQSSESVPLSICDTTGVPLNPENNWDLDLDRLRDAIRPNTRVISINFPNNPTGKVISHEVLHALIEIARERGIYVFSDEVYRLLERRPEATLPQVADIYERGLSLNVMSKAYGLPGLRIGWIACQDSEILWRMECIKHYLSICNSAPSELLAEIALKARDEILKRNRELVAKNLSVLSHFFAEHPRLFEWSVPDGGCIGYPKYLGDDGVEEFAKQLVEQAGVLLLPASIYRSELGPTPPNHFRIGYGRSHLQEGLEVMKNYVRNRVSSAPCRTFAV